MELPWRSHIYGGPEGQSAATNYLTQSQVKDQSDTQKSTKTTTSILEFKTFRNQNIKKNIFDFWNLNKMLKSETK